MKKLLITIVILFGITSAAVFLLPKAEEKPEQTGVENPTQNASAQTESLLHKVESTVEGVSELEAEDFSPEMSKEEYAKREAAGLTEENLAALKAAQKGKYAYESMEISKQDLYAEILAILMARAEDVIVSAIVPEDLDFVFQCVLLDHPEIFYVKGYVYTKYTRKEEIMRISFSGTYTMEEEGIAQMNKTIEAYATTCLAGLASDTDDYGKVKYVYEYLVANTEYNLSAAENQNICSVFVYRESVCQGYAKAMQFLLERMGIQATLVIGYVESGEGHAWNLVNIDGAYYYVDPTWGDAYYEFARTSETSVNRELPSINYDYLCVTTDQLCMTHTIDSIVPMPRCISLEANFYVREGAYFTTYDAQKAADLFRIGYETGNPYITLKCATNEVYQQMNQILITDQKVFEFIQNTGESIAFTNNDEQLTISFWL